MLKKFTVTNYRQFNETLIFDLTASNYTFNVDCTHDNLVKLALIYGTNGTGKSNLGWAIFDLVSHLTNNSFENYSRYYLNAQSKQKYAEFKFEFEFSIKDRKYQVKYEYQKNESRDLIYESFFIDNQRIIEYKLNEPFFSSLKGTEILKKELNSNQNISVLKYIYTGLNLSENDTNNAIFINFMEYVDKILWFRNVLDDKSYIGYKNGTENIIDAIIKNNNLSDFEKFLNDCGLKFKLVKLQTLIENDIAIKLEGQSKPLRFMEVASTGARNLALFYYWWQEIKQNKIPLLFIDEFDCSYHFELSEKIIEKLKELPNTQVILTTHNTNLLSNDLIRPDCGFIIDGKKIKSLNHLTDKELREAHNLEKLYQSGHFNNG